MVTPSAELSAAPTDNRSRVTGGDRDALGLWMATRVAVVATIGAAAWLVGDGQRPGDLLGRLLQWDAVHYAAIAAYGYDGDPASIDPTPLEAFFPGFPLVLRAVATTGLPYAVAGPLVSLVAGAVAVVALYRLAVVEAGPDGRGSRAVLLLLLSPTAVFLAAGYTEALFLALALPCWLAARRGSWAAAGLLATAACAVRVTGLFLAAALLVQWATTREHRRLGALPWLALPALPALAYSVYLEARTGDWLAWQHAQESHWGRVLTSPWEAFTTTWRAGFLDPGQPPGFAWYFRLEIVAVLVGVVLTGWLLIRRRWGESTYVGLQVAALATSAFYLSVPRATLLWWPLWTGLAVWSLRHRWVWWAYLSVSAPLMVLLAATYATGRWAG